MKFYVGILCICLVQICLQSTNATDEEKTDWKHKVHSHVLGASEQFVADFVFIAEKTDYNPMVERDLSALLSYLSILSFNPKLSEGKKYKIHKNGVKDSHSLMNKNQMLGKSIESFKLLRLILSKDVPPERLNNMNIFFYGIFYPNATSQEIESALSYLYGTGTIETNTTFFDLPDPIASDCPDNSERYTKAIDKIKLMVGIKSKVIDDSTAIRDKFPCLDEVVMLLERIAYLMTQFRGDQSKIDACTIATAKNLEKWKWIDSREYKHISVDEFEPILSTRLPDETFRSMINFVKASDVSTPIDQIQKALEYLYDGVPTSTTEC